MRRIGVGGEQRPFQHFRRAQRHEVLRRHLGIARPHAAVGDRLFEHLRQPRGAAFGTVAEVDLTDAGKLLDRPDHHAQRRDVTGRRQQFAEVDGERLEVLAERAAVRLQRADRLADRPLFLGRQRDEQLVLVVEIDGQRPLGHARGLGDGVHRRALVALGEKDLARAVENLPALVLVGSVAFFRLCAHRVLPCLTALRPNVVLAYHSRTPCCGGIP